MKRILKTSLIVILCVLIVGYLIPERSAMPCGTPYDYEPIGFWQLRGVNIHKGVDIFSKAGTPITSNTGGIVLFAGYGGDRQGNSVMVLGPKWRLHNYYHLKDINAKRLHIVKPGAQIGTVGNTGNAANTPSHVHYELATLIPYVWRCIEKIGTDSQSTRDNWLRMFYLDPNDHIPTKRKIND